LAQRPVGLQEYDQDSSSHAAAVGGPLTGPRVVGAPFSAEAITTLHKITVESRRPVNLSATARYYRDGTGRVRVEQPLPTDVSKGNEGTLVWVTLDDPEFRDGVVAVNPRTGVPGFLPRFASADCIGGGHTFAVPVGYDEGHARFLVLVRPIDYYDVRTLQGLEPKEESLGERSIEGVTSVGHRTTIILPAGQADPYNGSPVELIDERWESPELKLLVQSRVSDSRTGTIEYRLTNVRRGEPLATLFVIDKGKISSQAVGIGEEPWGNVPWR
jgi:hypothetical protein